VDSLTDDPESYHRLLRGQRAVLAQIARGCPLRDVLDSVARYAEESSRDLWASILVYDSGSGVLRRGGHCRLADEFVKSLDGLKPGPCAGSCGTAAFRRERVITQDIQKDPLWAHAREVTTRFGFRAAWSTPLISPETGMLLGVFGMYCPTAQTPSPSQLERLDHFTHLATIALEGNRREAALLESERLRHDAVLSLAIGVTHALNSPLSAAQTASLLLADHVAAIPSDLHQPLQVVLSSLERCTTMVRAFRSAVLERPEDPPQTVELCELTRRVLAKVKPTLDDARIVTTIVGKELWAFCSALRLEQVLASLVENVAQHAYSAGGPLDIAIARSSACPEFVEIVISDQGRGMSAAAASRCTSPFFTTARSAGHLGLGGFMARHVTESDLGGTLRLDTAPDRGTRWTVTFRAKLESTT
jgi:signal transduction histidine kinase